MRRLPILKSLMPVLALCFLPYMATADVAGMNMERLQSVVSDKGVTGQITFLYYDDLVEPREFYGEVLGLALYYEQEWVSIYRVAQGAMVGVVKLGREHLTPDMKRDSVMVSIVTDDLDEWHQRLKADKRVIFQKDIYDHPAVPIRAFLMTDPGGYSVELLKWRE